MCMYTGYSDAKYLAAGMVEDGYSEEQMLAAQPVFDSIPDDDAERVWKLLVATARGNG